MVSVFQILFLFKLLNHSCEELEKKGTMSSFYSYN